MSTSIHRIRNAADLRFALKNVPAQTPIAFATDIEGTDPDHELHIELTWAERTENAHFIRIGPGGSQE